MQQMMNFTIPKVDEKATRAKAKEAFETYHKYQANLKTMERAGMSVLRCFTGGPSGDTTARYIRNDADAIRGSSKRLPAVKEFAAAMQMIEKQSEELEKKREQIEGMLAFIEAVENVLAGLPEYERQIIEKTLMVEKRNRPKDYQLYNGAPGSLPFGKSEYYEHKEHAMLRIAFALCIEVYVREGEHAA